MRKLTTLLAILLASSNAQAALQINYSGNFVAFLSGSFSGQLIFDPLAPEFVGYSSGIPPESGNLFLSYGGNTVSNAAQVNGQAISILNTPLYVSFEDNVVVTQADIDSHGYNGLAVPGTYDFFSLGFEPFDNQYDANDNLISGISLSLTGIFASTAFTNNDLLNPNLAVLMDLSNPIYPLFEIQRSLNDGQDFRGAGVITDITASQVSNVPLPGAAWLFGSILVGLGLTQRRKA